ncbi:hypothetical protein GBF38_018340 [Nibea albiflora]|uniref:Uncharacterized protein n=1 Tax=Nibea albiflora TaxID=240163 RepID=A0ACB7ENV6_NIBAL|nr:hypothetical protein GBF38_018340 [Nibea albiflora]
MVHALGISRHSPADRTRLGSAFPGSAEQRERDSLHRRSPQNTDGPRTAQTVPAQHRRSPHSTERKGESSSLRHAAMYPHASCAPLLDLIFIACLDQLTHTRENHDLFPEKRREEVEERGEGEVEERGEGEVEVEERGEGEVEERGEGEVEERGEGEVEERGSSDDSCSNVTNWTCNVTRVPDDLYKYQLSSPSQCKMGWEDGNKVAYAHNFEFEPDLVHNVTREFILLKSCQDYMHFTDDCLKHDAVEEVHCRGESCMTSCERNLINNSHLVSMATETTGAFFVHEGKYVSQPENPPDTWTSGDMSTCPHVHVNTWTSQHVRPHWV